MPPKEIMARPNTKSTKYQNHKCMIKLVLPNGQALKNDTDCHC